MQERLKPLISISFILCLTLLFFNDFFWKAAFGSFLTGKLSDFCGLFIFPIFWSVFFPKRKTLILILTLVGFVYWKSSYSSTFIEFFSTYIFKINRVVDVTDLLALIILPLSWKCMEGNWGQLNLKPMARQLTTSFVGLAAFFSFCATSMPRYIQTFDQPQYVLFDTSLKIDSTSNTGDFEIYKIDSFVVVNVSQFYGSHKPAREDDYNKNLIIRDLDEDVSIMISGKRTTIPSGRINKLTVRSPQGTDYLRFNGSRLDGKFSRIKDGKTIIEGYYKMGIEDSIWTINDENGTTSTKLTFVNGERIKKQKFEGDQLLSEAKINTRADTIRNKYVQIGVLLLLTILVTVLIVRNYREHWSHKVKIKPIWKVMLCLFLPIVIWIMQQGIIYVLGDYDFDIFAFTGILLVIYVLTLPLLFIIVFWIKLAKPIDILWYSLLFSLAISTWVEYMVLSSLSSS